MKTSSQKEKSDEPDDVVMKSAKNVIDAKIRRPMNLAKLIKKKKHFVQVRSLNKAEILDECNLRMRAEITPPLWMNFEPELWRKELSRPHCKRNTYKCYRGFPFTIIRDLPKSYFIMYCDRCQRYSHTGREHWFSIPPQSSTTLKEFLLKRIKIHLHRLQLRLVDSWITHLDPVDAPKSTIMLSLNLQFQTPIGDKEKEVFDVECRVCKQICKDCSVLVDERELRSVVQLRQYAPNQRFLRSLEFRVRRNLQADCNIQKFKYTEHGVDFYLSNDRDAMALSHFFTTQAPVKCNQMRKHIQSCDCSSNNGSSVNCQNVITAVVCPILYHDLVYLPLMISATLGLQHMGPLVICLNMGGVISLLDPLNMRDCVINRDDYWKNPFESLKSEKDLVEYMVVDVNVISRKGNYTFADVQVVRVSKSGKNDMFLLARTHLGGVFKPGDHAFGYDLHELNITGLDIEDIKHMLPDAVLIRKKWVMAKQPKPHGLTRKKKKNQCYEESLKYLESNLEAMFNLSLNDGDDEKQNSELSSEKPENVGLELEDLLADLALNDRENRDASEKQ